MVSYSLTHSCLLMLTHAYSLTHSLTHSLTYSLIYSCAGVGSHHPIPVDIANVILNAARLMYQSYVEYEESTVAVSDLNESDG